MASEDLERQRLRAGCPLSTEVGQRSALKWLYWRTLSLKGRNVDTPSPEQVPASPMKRTVLRHWSWGEMRWLPTKDIERSASGFCSGSSVPQDRKPSPYRCAEPSAIISFEF